ncbi:MAG: DUF2782 domain-containing protein [Rhodocyclaceae bacterium]|nr:DUF2782 domain-containing protein [Rhodocyclaceae bacterium]
MRKLTSLALFVLLSLSLSAFAQQRPADLQPIPEPPPPPAGMADDPIEPQVTITKKGEDKVEEYRANGKLYMIKVTPPNGPAYYLVDQQGDGTFSPQNEVTGQKLRVPQWVIHRW